MLGSCRGRHWSIEVAGLKELNVIWRWLCIIEGLKGDEMGLIGKRGSAHL